MQRMETKPSEKSVVRKHKLLSKSCQDPQFYVSWDSAVLWKLGNEEMQCKDVGKVIIDHLNLVNISLGVK